MHGAVALVRIVVSIDGHRRYWAPLEISPAYELAHFGTLGVSSENEFKDEVNGKVGKVLMWFVDVTVAIPTVCAWVLTYCLYV